MVELGFEEVPKAHKVTSNEINDDKRNTQVLGMRNLERELNNRDCSQSKLFGTVAAFGGLRGVEEKQCARQRWKRSIPSAFSSPFTKVDIGEIAKNRRLKGISFPAMYLGESGWPRWMA